MNILINTPLLKSNVLKEDFDNKILLLFLIIITFLVIASLLFMDLIKSSNSFPIENDNPLGFVRNLTNKA